MTDKCKYYISNSGHSIKCRGIISDTSIKNIFSGPAEEALERKAAHLETYCFDRYNCHNCQTYQSIKNTEDDE